MDYICTYQNYSSFLSRCLNLQFKQSNQFGKSKNAFKNVDGLISMTVYSYPPSYTNHDYMYIIFIHSYIPVHGLLCTYFLVVKIQGNKLNHSQQFVVAATPAVTQ